MASSGSMSMTTSATATAAATRGRSVFHDLPSQRMASGLTSGPWVVKPTAQVPAELLATAMSPSSVPGPMVGTRSHSPPR